MWTRRDGRDGPPVELGAEFVHGRPPGLLAVAKAAGLRLRDADGEHWAVDSRRLARADSSMERAMALFPAAAEASGPLGPYLRRATRGQPRVWKAARLFGEGFYAADLSRAAARAVGEQARAAAGLHGDEFWRVMDGYDGVVAALARGVVARCSWRVTEVRWRRERVRVRAVGAAGGALPELSARAAVVTVPVSVLQAGGLRFQPALPPRLRWAIQGFDPGPIVKVALRFRSPVWELARGNRLKDFAMVHGLPLPLRTFWRPLPARAPVVIGWAAGPAGDALTGKPAPDILRAALHSLSIAFALPTSALEAELDAGLSVDWPADPLSRGGYAVVMAGCEDAPATLSEPVADTLFFAGEATHPDQPGTVHGAMETGERAARQVVEMLRKGD